MLFSCFRCNNPPRHFNVFVLIALCVYCVFLAFFINFIIFNIIFSPSRHAFTISNIINELAIINVA